MKHSLTIFSKIKNCKSIVRFAFAICMVFSLSVQRSHATHAAGADLTYRCLGGLQYELEATFYRDCGGVAEPSSITITYASASGGYNFTVTANKISGTGQEITVPCQTSASTCNGGTSTGIRKFVYRATVTLPAAKTDWVFSYSVCCRNCTITTIQNPCASTSLLYVESKLNNVAASCNSSPVFSNIPIAFVCIGQNFNYNHGVIDVDGDSLAYQLITPKISATATVTYISPNSTTTPVQTSTPFTLNATTGDLDFTPTQQQIGILAILVKEYRGGVLIGSVIRDMQVYTVPCTNNLPTATGINGSANYSMNVCPNQQVCFDIFTNDADATQTVSIISNVLQSIPSATITTTTGAHPTVHFCWTPTNADIGPLPNTFTVTVRDNACPTNGIQTFSYTLYVPGPNYTVSSTNVTCNGTHNGTATATPLYGGPFTYSWNTVPVQSAQTANNLAPGTYTVVVTDGSGCSVAQTATITEPPALNAVNNNTQIVCVGQCNGNIDLSVSGGVSPYTYAWSNGSTSQDVNGLCAGMYTVTVTDANNCIQTINSNIQPQSNIAGSITSTNVLCTGNNTGSADLSVSGGVGTYNYIWSNGATTQDLTNVPSGSYTVTVTDASSCSKQFNVTITQPAASLSTSQTVTNVNCFGDNTGSINLTVSGGTAPYAYIWSNGANTQNLTGVGAGVYTITVTDANSCTSTIASVAITQPAAALSATPTAVAVNCFGNSSGSINLAVNGGTAPYSYVWSNGATSQNATGLAAGTYSVTVTDSKGCTSSSASINITQPSAAMASTFVATNVNCFGNTTGAVNITVTGGTTPYTFAWNTGGTTEDLANVPAGTYSVVITDANGCTSVQNTMKVLEPAASLASSHAVTNVNCFGDNTGSINMTISGGTTPYSYLWNTGAITQDINSIAAGTYSITVTDANGCTSTNASIQVNQPAAALAYTQVVNNVSCFGNNTGSINLTITGGTTPYNYLWSNGATTQDLNNIPAGTYTVTITDANACTTGNVAIGVTQPTAALASTVGATQNVGCFGASTGSINLNVAGGTSPYSYLWSNGQTSEDISNIPAGTYTVTVTDAHGCTSNTNSISITQPVATLSTSISASQNVSCTGGGNGAIDLTVNGGTQPYSYQWSTGANTQDIGSLAAGTYNVTITDANGCTTSASGSVTQPSSSLSTSINSSQNVLCHGGNNAAISINVGGGTTPYSFSWSNGATTQNISGLQAGTYMVTVTDANGCVSTANQTITQPSAALSSSVGSTQNVSCFGLSNGSINVSVNGGTTPYSYSWSNGATTQNLSGIAAGNYSVTITDANGCFTNQNAIAIAQPGQALAGSVTGTQNVNCYGNSTGGINLSVIGGTSPYQYNWSNGTTSQNLTGVSAGSYSVTVTDANNCTTSLNALAVTQPAGALSSSIASVQNVSCFGGSNASINLTVNGGTAPYSYNWSNGATSQDLSSITSGNYSVTVTDANGCTINNNAISITQPAAALAVSTSSTNVNCFGNSTAGITITVTGGTTPYSYLWSNGASSQNISNIAAGSYDVTITDANGCTVSSQAVTITQPSAPLSSSLSVTDVLCHGNTTGAVNVTVTGGTSPYNYLWNNGTTSQDLTGIGAGTYSVTVTDGNGCTSALNSIAVTQPTASLNSSLSSSTNVACYGGVNGAITLNVNGGTTPYSFLWSNGATTQNITGLAAGIYSVTVTDANACTSRTNSIGINQPAGALSTNVTTSQNVSCNGGGNGSITLTVSGGTSPYTYNWSNGATTQSITGLYAGAYGVSITDANGCTTTATGTVSQPAGALSSSISSSQNVLCYGGTNGSVNLSVNGGTAPYNFQWSNGAITQNLSNLSAGNYSATVTDANGCISQSSVVIAQPTATLNASASTVQSVLCFGNATGSIDVTITGGTAPYTYVWSNGANTQDLTSIGAGNYAVTVTDANGCTYNLGSLVVEQPAAALAMSGTSSNVNCFGNNSGAIDITVTGGTAPYNYNWSNGAATQDITSVGAGNYNVVVTDANGCTVTNAGFTITQPAATLSTTHTVTDVNCFGNNSGSVAVTVLGGTQPYSFNWSNGSTSQNLSNVGSGAYTLTVTDANGCVASTGTVQISQPAAALAVSNAIANVGCYGNSSGSIDLTVTGGTQPYSYQWNTGATTQDLTNVAAGVYTVTITDANGCTSTGGTMEITQPGGALAATVGSSQNINCFGQTTGSINVTVAGGTAPYNYLWSTGNTSANLTNVGAGTYTVTVTDANGCVNAINSITLTQPTASLAGSISATQNVSCNSGGNGSIDLTVAGGTSPYAFNWSNGATTEDISGLSAGTYNVTVTDANACTTTVTGIVTQPAGALSSSISSSQNILCHGGATGSITLAASGGTAPYSFAWSNGSTTQNLNNIAAGTYVCTITDANGCVSSSSATLTEPSADLAASISSSTNVSCFGNNNGAISVNVSGGTSPYSYNWSNGATSSSITNLIAGNYAVTVTDGNGCIANINAIAITQPAAPLTTAIGVTQNVNCFGQNTGSISVTVNGGTAPYAYNWSNGNNTQNITNLAAGNYSVTVTDANGCTENINAIAISQPGASLGATVTSTQNVSCTGGGNGSIDVTVSGGTMPYSYSWSNGSTSEDISGLATGAYTVNITDANGCTFTLTETVTQPANNLYTAIQASQNVNCYGGNNGNIDLTASGGTSPYTFSWSNGETTEDISNLQSGTYTVTVTDANGCYNNQTVTITQPSAALASAISGSQNILCFGGNNGNIDLTVSGGTAPYSFTWSNGASTEDLSGLTSGTYDVTVTDVNGCTTVNSVLLSQPVAALTTSIPSSQDVSCYGGTNGTINLDIQGGTFPYSVQWSNGSTSQNQTNLAAGNYSVIVTDANGCTSTLSQTINEPSASLNAAVSSVQPVNCFANATGVIDITINGGTSPFTYSWSNGATTEDLNNVVAGTYTVSITDANGCTTGTTVTISQPSAALSASTNVIQNVSCFGGNNGAVDLTAGGGTPPYSYNWSNGSTSEDLSGLSTGTYTVTITDANGCTVVGSATITQPTGVLNATYVQTASVLCFGGTNGALDLTVIGGTSPYSYQWSNGATTEDLTGVAAGNYTVMITDINGCTFNLNATITQPLAPLAPSTSVTPVGCFSDSTGSIILTVVGGTPPFQFYWSNGATSQNLTNISGGTYWVTVIDSNNCSAQAWAYVRQPEGALWTTPVVTNVNCVNLNSGAVLSGTTGGSPPYSYVWSNGATTPDLINVIAGHYVVTVTDSAGCTRIDSVDVQGPLTLLGTGASVTNVGCFGASSGSITLNVAGGIPNYSFVWSNGATTQNVTNLAAGSYTVTITDSYGCTKDSSFAITQPATGISDSVSTTQVTCYGLNNGGISVTPIGGTAPYSFQWSNGATTASINNLAPGNYTVTITDGNGCTKQETVDISQPASSLNITGNGTNSNCLSGIAGTVTVNISGGTAPYTYTWSNGAITQNLASVGAGTYSLTATDANGCISNFTQTITDLSQFSMTAGGPTEFCIGGTVTLNALVVNGGNYQWYQNGQILTGATQSSFTTPAPGSYTVTCTNSCGTFTSSAIEVKVFSVGDYSVSPNVVVCPALGEYATLSAYGGASYHWNPDAGLSNANIANPVATPKATTVYTVTIASPQGCTVTAEVVVGVDCDTLFIPTGFSPDNNAINDVYVIDGLSKYPGNHLYIYNRWGNLVYKKKDYDNTWNGTSNVSGIYLGKQLPNGTYYFILDLNDGTKPRQGYITLKR